MELDPSDVRQLNLNLHDQFRHKALHLLDICIHTVNATNVKCIKCTNPCDGTPKQHKQQLLRMLKRLHIRFKKTTSSEGGACFREDIEQLLLDLQQVLNAGMLNCFHVQYIKWDSAKGVTQTLFSVH